ncbi:MAG: hypothetical protein O3A63_15110, partial [Proteobacteria bacterium]|nr:hypothetical protein [Pseudomonadota bacterium]
PQPAVMTGHSVKPLFTQSDQRLRGYAFAEHNWHGRNAHERSARDLEYLYISNQWPLHGVCHNSQFRYLQSYKALQQANAKSQLPAEIAECFAQTRATEELYAVDPDPHSQKNLADDPAYEQVLLKMRTALTNWRLATSDPDYEVYCEDC